MTKKEKDKLVRKLRILGVYTACCTGAITELLAEIENPVFDPSLKIEAVKSYIQAITENGKEL